MEDFEWRGRRLRCWTSPGIVLSSEKRNEMHVRSSGGGVVHHGPYHSSVTTPTISSTNVTKHEFWYRPENGTEEIAVRLSGVDIPLREGQSITMVGVEREGTASGVQAVLVNRTANRHWLLMNATALDRTFRLGRWSSAADRPDMIATGVGGLVLFVLVSLLGIVRGAGFLSMVVCLLLAMLVVVGLRARERRALMARWLEGCAQECYRATGPLRSVRATAAQVDPSARAAEGVVPAWRRAGER